MITKQKYLYACEKKFLIEMQIQTLIKLPAHVLVV